MEGLPPPTEIVFCATNISYCLSRFFAMRSWAAVAAEAIVDWDSGGFSKPASSCASSSTITVQSSCPELFFLTGNRGVYESFLRFILLDRLSLDLEKAPPPLVAATRKPRELLLPVALFVVAVFLSILMLLEMVWVDEEPPPPFDPWCFSKCCYC